MVELGVIQVPSYKLRIVSQMKNGETVQDRWPRRNSGHVIVQSYKE